jgi:hypothetical protein
VAANKADNVLRPHGRDSEKAAKPEFLAEPLHDAAPSRNARWRDGRLQRETSAPAQYALISEAVSDVTRDEFVFLLIALDANFPT